jgi:hypothetical protein
MPIGVFDDGGWFPHVGDYSLAGGGERRRPVPAFM